MKLHQSLPLACLNQTPLDWAGNQARILAAIELSRFENGNHPVFARAVHYRLWL